MEKAIDAVSLTSSASRMYGLNRCGLIFLIGHERMSAAKVIHWSIVREGVVGREKMGDRDKDHVPSPFGRLFKRKSGRESGIYLSVERIPDHDNEPPSPVNPPAGEVACIKAQCHGRRVERQDAGRGQAQAQCVLWDTVVASVSLGEVPQRTSKESRRSTKARTAIKKTVRRAAAENGRGREGWRATG